MDTLSVESIVRAGDFAPEVLLSWGSQQGALSPRAAIQLAFDLMGAAEAARSDAMLIKFLRERVEIDDPVQLTQILGAFREYRHLEDLLPEEGE